MNHTKGINIKMLALGMFSTLLFSFLWVSITDTYLLGGLSLIENMYSFAILGYLEVVIGYIVLLLLLFGINFFVKRKMILFVINIITLSVIWFSVFSCVENWVPILFSSRSAQEYFFIFYGPPFFIKLLFFIYYIYKEKQEYKKTQI